MNARPPLATRSAGAAPVHRCSASPVVRRERRRHAHRAPRRTWCLRADQGPLNGIDAPEKKQPFAERAKQAMSDLVYMKDVDLDCRKTDRYSRSVCKVMVAPASAPAGRRRRTRAWPWSPWAWLGGIEPTRASKPHRSAGSMNSRRPNRRRSAQACGETPTPWRHGTGASSNKKAARRRLDAVTGRQNGLVLN